MSTVRWGDLKFDVARLTDTELDTVIDNVTRRLCTDQAFLRVAVAERTGRTRGRVPVGRTGGEHARGTGGRLVAVG